jgi:hypothetical protein
MKGSADSCSCIIVALSTAEEHASKVTGDLIPDSTALPSWLSIEETIEGLGNTLWESEGLRRGSEGGQG